MKNIKALYTIIFVSVLFILVNVACGSKKTAATSFFSNEENKELLTFDKSKIDSVTNEKTEAKETEVKSIEKDENESVIKIEFDTEKPLNTETFLPPVKSIEIKQKGQKTAENTAKTVDKTNIKDKEFNADLDTGKKEVINTDTEEKQPKQPSEKKAKCLSG